MTDLKRRARQYSDTEIIYYAKDVVSDHLVGIVYPKWPVDEQGMPDTSDGVGCVPWCSVSSCEVVDTRIEEKKEREVFVIVTVNLVWMDDGELSKEDASEFCITVYTDYSTLQHEEIVRCD